MDNDYSYSDYAADVEYEMWLYEKNDHAAHVQEWINEQLKQWM